MSVFVVQQPKPGVGRYTYDISPCLQHGQPTFVFSQDDQPGITPGPSKQHVEKVLRNFNDDDFILWAGGDPFGLALVVAVAADINQGRFKFLRWERERVDGKRTGSGYYVPLQVNMRGK